MEKRKICLFTAHSPQTGGGGVILRSLIAGLSDISVSWYYIGDSVVPGYENGYLGKAVMGGKIINDIWQTWKMLADRKVAHIDNLVKQLLQVECDEYWIVSHNEGLRVALELTRRQTRPVHMTIHDDWAGALCARSVRYRLLSYWAKKLTVSTLKAATSFDVVSSGMRDYYWQLTGIKSEVCHRYLSQDAIRHEDTVIDTEQPEIVAGHIGSIYSKADFITFLSVFLEFAIAKEKKPMLKMWGCHLTMNDIPAQLKGSVCFYETLPEEQVLPELAKCAFLYAMYPFNDALRIFSKTSLPTKLTSYLQAGRPILGQGPADSTLAAFLSANSLGAMWVSTNKEEGFECLENIFSFKVGYQQLENARRQYFGGQNLDIVRRALLNC